jgi:hypothetical protein
MKDSSLIGDNSSKRAFPLDSRAIWVEQMIDKHGTVVHRDNLVNGPGEYEPKLASTKHVSSPSLGKHISPFKTFKSSVSRPDLNSFNNSSVSSIPYQKQNSSLLIHNTNDNIYERNEMLTLYHGHDKMRHALDPKLRYTNTPGPYITHQPILEAVKYNGKVSPQKVFFGPDNIPFGERGGQDIKIALPDYVPNFDSKYVRKSILLSKISPSERFSYNKKYNSIQNKLSSNGSISSISQVSSTNNSKNISAELITRSRTPSPSSSYHKASIFHVPSARDNQTVINKHSFAAEGEIKKPKLKFRVWPKLQFDSSCYDNYKKPMPSGLTPAAIDKAINLHPFERMLKTKKLYQSSIIGSRISDKIKRTSSPILYR